VSSEAVSLKKSILNLQRNNLISFSVSAINKCRFTMQSTESWIASAVSHWYPQ
jgi:hypothetical protein